MVEPVVQARLVSVLDNAEIWPNNNQADLVEPLSGGLNNHTFKVQSGEHDFVVRLSDPEQDHTFDLDRAQEIEALQHAAQVAVAPRLIYAEPQAGVLVTEFLLVVDTDAAVDDLVQVATLLQTVHALPPIDKALVLSQVVTRYRQQLEPWAAAELALLTDKIDALIAMLEAQSVKPCLCHNDLVPGNLLATLDGLKLVDWEYAAMGDPFYDLAVFGYYRQLDAAATQQLLTAYLGHPPTLIEQRRYRDTFTAYLYIDLLWHVLKQYPTRLSAAVPQQLAQQQTQQFEQLQQRLL